MKMRALLQKLFIMPLVLLAVPVVLLIRVLRPLVLIRFRYLRSNRIGHFAANTEVYLCERDAGMHGQRVVDIFYYRVPICNHQLKKMWDRSLHISWFSSLIANLLDRTNYHLPGGEKHVVPWRKDQGRDIYGLLAHTEPHLSFTAEEERLGYETLEKIGVEKDAPFVCFHARDSAYLDAIYPDLNWHYHDYRDSNIHNYIPAMEELICRGYYAIRMGAIVKEALNTANPKIIDYATNSRTEFMDIFLGAKCYFFLGSTAGIYAISEIFRRPIAWVNHIPLEHAPTWGKNNLFIPKKLWLREEHRFLTFREILDSGVGRFIENEQYEKYGIEVIENTPEEITALAIEMDERLKGTWQTTEEDEKLQRRFWALFKPSELNQVFRSRIGAEFLRQNQELLE
jgi:putative glycosyltransferase (TIGR04372 family)